MKYLKHSLFPALNMCRQVIQFLDVSNAKYLEVGTAGLQRAKENRKHHTAKLDTAGAFRPGEVRDQWLSFHVSGTKMRQFKYAIISLKPHKRLRRQILF